MSDALQTISGRLPELLGRQRAGDRCKLVQALEGKRVLVTGAGGSIGSVLSETLAGGNLASLTLLDIHENSLFRLRQLLSAQHAGSNIGYVLADVRNQRRIGQILDEVAPELLLHLAAYKHVPLAEELPEEFAAVNVLGTWRLLQEAKRVGVKKIVYPSTDKAVNPPSIYGATKRSVELALQSAARAYPELDLTVVRLVNVIGAWGGVIETFVRQISAGEPLTVTHRDMTRYWITMDEALQLLLAGAAMPASGNILLPDLGEAVKVTAMAERLWSMLRPGEAGPPMTLLGSRPGERMAEELSYADERLLPTETAGVLRVDGGRRAPDLAAVTEWVARLEAIVQRSARDEVRRELFEFATSLVHA